MKLRKKGVGLFFDLDDFKKVNDRFGHLMGDKALKLFSDAIKNSTSKRKKVYPYRLYGDEFFVFAEGYQLDIIDEIKVEIENYLDEEKHSLNSEIVISSSVGYSEYTPGMDIDDFIKEADYSMYKDKIKRKSKQKRR
jgi:diguanylate cyclase (GGDEF)-like protein